ncbi:MAG: hypothetical protein FWJ73_03870 [Limnochordales bacterium]
MYHVSDVIELLLVTGLFFLGLALMYLVQRWIDREEQETAGDED